MATSKYRSGAETSFNSTGGPSFVRTYLREARHGQIQRVGPTRYEIRASK